jgi:translation initiation factor 3 subunit H
LDIDQTLEMTNCLPFPNIQDDQGDSDDESGDYQIEMMRCLRDVNIDHNTVGWYQTTYMGSFVNDQLIETQYNYQSTLPKSVVVVYDPLKSTQGALALKAYRLTDSFMTLFAQGQFTTERYVAFQFFFFIFVVVVFCFVEARVMKEHSKCFPK